MKLKGEKISIKKINFNFLKNKLNRKNLVVFLISFFIISLIIGILFFFYLNNEDTETIKNNIRGYFTIKEEYNYLKLLKDSILETSFNIIKIWLFGISVIGIVIVLFLFWAESFSTGFSFAAIFKTYGIKGILGAFAYLFPTRLVYLLIFFILSLFAIKISYKIIMLLFFKKEVDINNEMRRYFKILIFSLILGVFYSLLEVFISPIMIKIWTFLVK